MNADRRLLSTFQETEIDVVSDPATASIGAVGAKYAEKLVCPEEVNVTGTLVRVATPPETRTAHGARKQAVSLASRCANW